MRLFDPGKIKINQRVQRFAVALEDKGLYCHIKPKASCRKKPSIPDIHQHHHQSRSLTRPLSNLLPCFHSELIVSKVIEFTKFLERHTMQVRGFWLLQTCKHPSLPVWTVEMKLATGFRRRAEAWIYSGRVQRQRVSRSASEKHSVFTRRFSYFWSPFFNNMFGKTMLE